MTKLDEKIKNFPIKKRKKCKKCSTIRYFYVIHFLIKNPSSKANPTNPSFESTGKK